MPSVRHKSYQGEGPEIVWVGEGSEVCALGYESDKHRFLKTRRYDVISLGLRMGFLKPYINDQGEPAGVIETPPGGGETRIALSDQTGIDRLHDRWADYLYRHTGIRSLSPGETTWSPENFPTRQDLQTRLPQSVIAVLQSLGIPVEIGRELNAQESEGAPFTPGATGAFFEVTLPAALEAPFAFKVDLGAPLPKGWGQDTIGLSIKELKGMNPALAMAHEVVYRALLNAGIHPAQADFKTMIPAERMGLYLGSGIGAHAEQERMFFDTFRGEQTGAKVLANSIANIAAGYISARLGIKGKISTHVGACETCLGSIADAYHDLKSGHMQAAIAGGFDDVMTPASYNGFSSNMAFTTNEKVVENIASMIAEGAIVDARLQKMVQEIQQRAAVAVEALAVLERQYKDKQTNFFDYQKKRRLLREEKRLAFLNLPKELAELSSQPFAKYRSGFIMGTGGGAGFFTTLETALKWGLPIRAFVSGVAEMVPDSGEDGASSIAALGDGVGDAYARAFEMTKKNYGVASIDEITAWFAHGTSTPLNGWGERKEIERVHKTYGRSSQVPLLLTGDKAEVGHRVAGNFPSLVGYMFEHNEILPVGNYLQPGFSPQGRRGFGEPLDELFNSSRVVGKAGVGHGKAVPFHGDYIAVNGAGFGRINTVLIFRRFNLSEVVAPPDLVRSYEAKRAQVVSQRERLKQRILFQIEPLVR